MKHISCESQSYFCSWSTLGVTFSCDTTPVFGWIPDNWIFSASVSGTNILLRVGSSRKVPPTGLSWFLVSPKSVTVGKCWTKWSACASVASKGDFLMTVHKTSEPGQVVFFVMKSSVRRFILWVYQESNFHWFLYSPEI